MHDERRTVIELGDEVLATPLERDDSPAGQFLFEGRDARWRHPTGIGHLDLFYLVAVDDWGKLPPDRLYFG
jgi:hypothetical protein